MKELYLVGIGPGEEKQMTVAAHEALEKADVLCGYTAYINLIKDRYPGKEFYSTPMKHEVDRCQWAIDTAASGKSVAMLCSGDAGVYGMAGPVLELIENDPNAQEVHVEMIPGVSAVLSGAALLGAPLMSDFCVISLSDLLTPWPWIEKRLRAAAEGDFSIILYNPMSHHRPEHLKRACEILMETKSADTVCGWAKNIGREGEEKKILTLQELKDEKVDMFTTVFIGASTTKQIGEWMVTPRGYQYPESEE